MNSINTLSISCSHWVFDSCSRQAPEDTNLSLADEHPSALVIGTDLSPIQPAL
jgi:hypothetical protein